ncbi:hypothetical protein [Nitrosomonas sp. Nm166]|uniref:hypothetical protein n=1 Tax=Nitrosomonas sp. Nm166 TaxID=1881054 RepID=UPI000B82CB2E|nr:hypothetical protein [Nitrosomonas sp. Nm166]
MLAAHPAQAEVKAGDILVIDQLGGTDGRGALFVIDPATGQRTILSDFGNAAQGSLGSSIASVAVFRCRAEERTEAANSESEAGNRNPDHCADGETIQIFVSDLFSGSGSILFKVDPNTGHRTLISDFSQGDIQGFLSYGLVVDAKGQVIVNLQTAGPDSRFQLVRIDPETDTRTLITDLLNPDQGAILPDRFITDLAVEHTGKILMGANINDTLAAGTAIFRINPSTGKRRLLSDFADAGQGPVAGLFSSAGLATEASRQILAITNGVLDENNNTIGGNFLLRVDRRTGQRTILSDFDNPAQGTLGQNIRGSVVEKYGKIIVSANDAVTGETTLLFRIDPETGQRDVLSDSANLDQGPLLSMAINYLAIVPNDDDAEDLSTFGFQQFQNAAAGNTAPAGTATIPGNASQLKQLESFQNIQSLFRPGNYKKINRILQNRPLAPTNVNLFSPAAYPNAAPMAPAGGPAPTEEQVAQMGIKYLEDQFPMNPSARRETAALFNNPDLVSKVPNPSLRAGLLGLAGTAGEPAIDFVLNAKTDAGLPKVRGIGFDANPWDPADTTVARALVDPNTQQVAYVFNPKYQNENPFQFSSIIAHETLHSDLPISTTEEVTALAIQSSIYLEQLAKHPEMAGDRTELTRRNNTNTLARLNSGAGTSLGLFASNNGKPILPGSQIQATSWFDQFANATGFGDTPGNPQLQAMLARMVNPGGIVPPNADFSMNTLNFIDQNSANLSKRELVRAALALQLNIQGR